MKTLKQKARFNMEHAYKRIVINEVLLPRAEEAVRKSPVPLEDREDIIKKLEALIVRIREQADGEIFAGLHITSAFVDVKEDDQVVPGVTVETMLGGSPALRLAFCALTSIEHEKRMLRSFTETLDDERSEVSDGVGSLLASLMESLSKSEAPQEAPQTKQ